MQVVYKPRSKEREVLGIAEIVLKEKRWVTFNFPSFTPTFTPIGRVSYIEAKADGFESVDHMVKWVTKTYRLPSGQRSSTIEGRNDWKPMNKLTVKWVERR